VLGAVGPHVTHDISTSSPAGVYIVGMKSHGRAPTLSAAA
jgi:hypothetical protein